MRKKRLVLLSIFAIAPLCVLFLTMSSAKYYNLETDASERNKEFILKELKMENSVLDLSQPSGGEISGLVLNQKVGERPTFTFSYSKLGKIPKTKEAKVVFSINGTGNDKRSLELSGRIKIKVDRMGKKFIKVSVVDNDFIFSGTDSAGTTVSGTMFATDAFTASGKMFSINFAVLFSGFESELGTIEKE